MSGDVDLLDLEDGRALLLSRQDGDLGKLGGTPQIISRGKEVTIFESPRVGLPDTYTVALVRYDQPNATRGILGSDGAQIPVPDPDSELLDAPLVAHVWFGTGRTTQTRVSCDWINGLLLTIPAGYFRISCEYPATPGFPVNMPMLVGAMATPGVKSPSMGQVSQARFTQRFTLEPDQTQLLRIPTRAHALRLFTDQPDLYGSYRVSFLDSSNVDRVPSWSIDPAGATEEMPLGGANRAVSIRNGAAVASRLAVQWSISL